jgi:multiple sugar transport system ATP-binding protein
VASISFRQVGKRFNDTEVVRDINLDVADGELLVFVGPSGCGKSTMLRMVAGLEDISSGELMIDGVRVNDLGPSERGAAMVFQSYALYPHMTVAQNMGFGLRMAGSSKSNIASQVQAAAETLQITHLLDRFPKQLSGGQRQRVAIGRAIVRRPKVFLFDEPLSNLDASLRVQLRIELAKLHQQLKTTMIYVTHDQTEAMTLGNRIAVFNQGRIEQLGTPAELYQRPVNRFVAEFLGTPKINMIPYQWDATVEQLLIGDGIQLDSSFLHITSTKLSKGATIGLRPEHLSLGNLDSPLKGTVEFLEYLGDSTLAYMKIQGLDTAVKIRINKPNTGMKLADVVGLACEPGFGLVFNRDEEMI